MVDRSATGGGRGFLRFEVLLPVVVVLIDQFTKALVRRALPIHDSISVIPGLLAFTHVRNTGAAFGFLNGVDFPFKMAVIVLVAAAALSGVAWYAAALPADQKMARAGLALIIGGAVGNLIDRIFVGSVVDFVDVYWRTHHFWAFNIADSAISVGVAVMLADMLGLGSTSPKTT